MKAHPHRFRTPDPLRARPRVARPTGPGLLVLLAGVVLMASLAGRAAARGDAAPVVWQPAIEVAAGEAHVTPWRMNASDWRYVDDPTVAVDPEGFIGVAWADQSRKDIFFQLYDPEGKARLSRPVNVSSTPGIFSWLPRVVIRSGEARHVYVLWQEIVFSGGSHGGEIFFARSSDGGRTFDRPLNLSRTPAGDGKGRLTRDLWHNGSLDLALGPDGALHAAWTEYEGTLWFSRSTDGGRSFSSPLRVAGGRGADPARGPSLAVDHEGRVVLAWAVGEDPAADIRLAVSNDGGRSFGAPRVLFRSGGHTDAPKVALDGQGVLHLVYAESPGGPFQRYQIRYARSADQGRTFESPREISGASAGSRSANFPCLGVDGRGRVIVVWELFPDPHGRPRGLAFTRSHDGGGTFASPSVVPGTVDPDHGFNGSRQGFLMRKLAVGRDGAFALVNSTFRSERDSRVRLHRGRIAER